MHIVITQATKDAIIGYARQIAQYRGYTNLVDGLQPASDLEAKYYHEWGRVARGHSLQIALALVS
jgi:hypothetical protein